MKAILINKDGLVFDTANFETLKSAIKWAKDRGGKYHLTIEMDAEKGIYINYKIVNNRAYRVELKIY